MIHKLRRRFRREGLFWRQFIVWAVRNVPPMIEPFLLWLWCGLFFIGFASGRRAAMNNLGVIEPHRGPFWRFRKAFRMFWKFSCTLTDTTRFHETGMSLDWEVAGAENLALLARDESGIVVTAHMGNYDIGAYMFARDTGRSLSVVRAAESDAETEIHAKAQRERAGQELGAVDFRDSTENPALDLFTALRSGHVVAIQGDRAVAHVATVETSMFGRAVTLPSGPFALALATGARVWPLIITRRGPRYYRAIAFPPITVRRTGRDRNADIMRGVREWVAILEPVIREHADQWFAFYEAFGEPTNEPTVDPVPIPRKEDASGSAAWIAPDRFLFALSRLIARMRGGSSRDSELRGHRVLPLKPGQNTAERRVVATFAFLTISALAYATLPFSQGPAIVVGLMTPFLFWMLLSGLTSAVLFAAGHGMSPVASRVQQRVALVAITIAAAALLRQGLLLEIVGAAWLLLVTANAVARVMELLRRREDVS